MRTKKASICQTHAPSDSDQDIESDDRIEHDFVLMFCVVVLVYNVVYSVFVLEFASQIE